MIGRDRTPVRFRSTLVPINKETRDMMLTHARLALALASLVTPALILTAGLDAPAATRGVPAPHSLWRA